ncbi:MAG: hypothetical protein J0M04_01500 [Verrucomicrobia bacterium]|nr:hypothetical protein [Verrucomicrobiota bacterium]
MTDSKISEIRNTMVFLSANAQFFGENCARILIRLRISMVCKIFYIPNASDLRNQAIAKRGQRPIRAMA